MRLLFCSLVLSAVAVGATLGGSAEHNPIKHRPAQQAQSVTHRLIVKLRAGSSARAHGASGEDRVTSLTDRDVEYAEPDQRRYAHAVPNDTLYPAVDASHPGQWYMQNPATISAPAAVNAEAAKVTTGSTQSFAATASDVADESVTWEVNGVAGGNSTSGRISSTGVYAAPSAVPSPSTVTITAVSTADSTVTATASVTIAAAPKSGGGSQDPFTLLVEGLVTGWVAWSRSRRRVLYRYKRLTFGTNI